MIFGMIDMEFQDIASEINMKFSVWRPSEIFKPKPTFIMLLLRGLSGIINFFLLLKMEIGYLAHVFIYLDKCTNFD